MIQGGKIFWFPTGLGEIGLDFMCTVTVYLLPRPAIYSQSTMDTNSRSSSSMRVCRMNAVFEEQVLN